MYPLKLDVIVPTYNRSVLLQRTLASLLRAPIPAGLQVSIIVVDNNSKDDTAEVVASWQARREEQGGQPDRALVYVKETAQGLSNARNGGIRSGNGDLIGFIDDDEEIEAGWYQAVAREFADSAIQFIGGPYLANYAAPVPDWLPPGYHAVIGVVDPKPRTAFVTGFSGNLMGGNAVIRRSVFEQVGLYSPKLGRSGKGLLSEEDAEFYRRLLAAGLLGFHVPDLIIFHHIPADRLTRSYHRRWCFWRAVSQGVLDRSSQQPVPYALGVPRYMLGRALRGLGSLPRRSFSSKNKGPLFAEELAIWDLAGFFYGRHLIDIDRLYTAKG